MLVMVVFFIAFRWIHLSTPLIRLFLLVLILLLMPTLNFLPFFFQAEDGIRDADVTGVQTCALPIWLGSSGSISVCCSDTTMPHRHRVVRTTVGLDRGRSGRPDGSRSAATAGAVTARASRELLTSGTDRKSVV